MGVISAFATRVEGAGMEVGMLVTVFMLMRFEGRNGDSGEEPSSMEAKPCSSFSRSSSLKPDCG